MLRAIEIFVYFLITTTVGQQHPRVEHIISGPPGSEPAPEPIIPPEDKAAVKACRDRILNTNPSTADHFSDATLNTICHRSAVWQRTVVNTSAKHSARRANFTDAQLSWLQSLYKCEDVNCICERSSVCSKFDISNNTSRRHRTRSKRQQFPVDNFLPNRAGRALRREIRQMSDNDRWRYFRSVQRLKNDFIDGMSKYDIMVMYHTPDYAPEGHFSAALLPYHREMMKNLELALRMYDPGVSLPYWDSTVDAPLPNPADSVLWTGDFFGNGFGDVINGPFTNWFVFRDEEVGTLSRSGRLMRNLGRQGRLMDEGIVNTILNKPRYRNLVFCVDPFTELSHGATHMWVGGHMGPLRTSPNDPVFYALHAFIDHIWENWRWRHQGYQQRENEYSEPCNGAGRFDGQMQPYPLSNADGLSNRYTEVFYSYTDRPFCPNCGGTQYLFCDTRWNKCVSKIRLGGLCRGFEGFDACANGQCVDGRCVGGQFTGGNTNANVNANNNDDSTNNAQGGSCQNDHACCVYWTNAGECDRNQAWMRSNCRAACRMCSGGNNGGCTDTQANCAMWASNGECQSNAAWMSIGCPVTCNSCDSDTAASSCNIGAGSGASANNNVQRGASQPAQCVNNDNRCARWARSGECNRNQSWMNSNCRRACNACG